jgi:hypothetical protein
MSNIKSLEEVVAEAKRSLLKAESDLAIKSYIIDQLTDDEGNIIDTEIHFELGDLKINIGKKRAYNKSNEGDVKKVQSSKKQPTKRVHRSKSQKKAIFAACLNGSFNNLKKKDAVTELQKVSPDFTDNLWNDFIKSPAASKLEKQGETRNMTYTFNIAQEISAPKAPSTKRARKPRASTPTPKKAAPKKAAPKKAAPKKAAPKKAAPKKAAPKKAAPKKAAPKKAAPKKAAPKKAAPKKAAPKKAAPKKAAPKRISKKTTTSK